MAGRRGYPRRGAGSGRKARLARTAQATSWSLRPMGDGVRIKHKSNKIDARRILEQMSALDRVRFVRWIEMADAFELEMPPPVIAEIIQRARERLGIKS